jgi:uncharacterized protein involved in exopolysaccharide biosynthesis
VSTATEEWRDDADIDFRQLLRTVWARRVLVGIVAAACGILAGAVSFVMTPVYRASTVLVPASDRGFGDASAALGQLGGLASLAGIEIGGSNVEVEEALAVLRSREFTEKFIREKNLLPVLFAHKWDAAAGHWQGEEAKWPTLAKGFRYFNRKLRFVVFDKKTNLITVQVEWRDRQAAAQWANELVARVNEEMRTRAIARAGANVRYLEQELQGTSNVETRNAIGRLIEAHIKQRMLANVSQEYAFRIVDKALPPDADDPVRPQKLQLIVVGAFAGLAFAIIWVLIRDGRRGPLTP